MDFLTATEKSIPMAVTVDGIGTEILTTDVLYQNNKVAYFDAWWCSEEMVGGNPIHGSTRTISGDNPWTIGRLIFCTIDDSHPLWNDWLKWNEYKNTVEGIELSSRERALYFLENYLK